MEIFSLSSVESTLISEELSDLCVVGVERRQEVGVLGL